MIERIFKAYDNLHKRRLVGDMGVGLLFGVITSIVLHTTGAVDGQIWNVPWAVIYGSGVTAATMLVSDWIGRYFANREDSE